MSKEIACGKRAKGSGYGVQSMTSDQMKKFIETKGTVDAKEALKGKVKSRGELCVILHSFREGRKIIQEGGVSSNFRLTPSPNRAPAPVKVRARRAAQTIIRRGGKTVTARSGSNTNSNMSPTALLNKLIANANAARKMKKPIKSYTEYQYGVRILGSRPSGKAIKDSLMRKTGIVGRASSSSSSASSGNRSIRGGRSSRGSSASSRSGSNRNGSNRNSGGNNNGNGINRSHYQNLTAKRSKEAKVKNTSSRFAKKKKNLFPKIKINSIKHVVHRGRKTKSPLFMVVPSTGGTLTARKPTRPGAYFIHGSRSVATKNQLRMANNERWRRYENVLKRDPTNNTNKRSALANKLMIEAIANVLAGKVTTRPRAIKRMKAEKRNKKPAQSELGKIFGKSYMTGQQLEPYYKPLKKKVASSSSGSGSGSNSSSGSNKKNVNSNED